MTEGLLIDTCALIWLAANAQETHLGPVERALDQASEQGLPICLSPISGWEVGMLAAKGRLPLTMPPQLWLDRIMVQAGMTWADMPIDVLVASSTMPGTPHGDPADRIIVATAREYGLRIVTRDAKILDYAARGHVLALAC